MDPNIKRRFFFQGYNYRLSSINKNTAYYKCLRYDSANCCARLLIKHDSKKTLLLRLREKYSSQPYHIRSKRKIYGIKRKLRGLSFANSIQAAQLPPLKNLQNGNPFFRRYWSGDFDGEFHQMLLWSTNEALSLMRSNNQTFIDCTFQYLPSPFKQCLIIMVYDIGTQMYIPC
ncbi:hypothetical protein MXB_5711, partial [Myxobolus squamalis]